MHESILAILAENHRRLAELTAGGEISSPPEQLRLRHRNAVFLGRPSREQQAIATLYGQACTEHKAMHIEAGLPEGINPRVSFDHFYNHVTAPMLSELLIWSAHRDHPEVSETMSIIAIQFDHDWNMYALPRGSP